MNKVKTSGGKKCAPNSEPQCAKSERTINLEEKLENLTLKKQSVNGLVNGVDRKHNETNKTNKRDRKNCKDVKRTETKGKHKDTMTVNSLCLDTNSVNLDKLSRLDSLASTSDVNTSKCDLNNKTNVSDLKTTKGKSKAKKSDADKPNSESSSKIDGKLSPEDIDSPDFDITSIIRLKYSGQAKEDKKDVKLSDCDKVDVADQQKTDQLDEDSSDLPKIDSPKIDYVQYDSELQMPMIMKIIQKDLSEPYSIYTYRYFIHNWPNLCFLAMCNDDCVGAIVCKLDLHRKVIKRGYIAMLAVDKNFRKHGIGSTLVRRAIQEMIVGDADEVVLETEITNKPALRLYEALGFVRDKRLFRYYLNGVDALRLKLWLR